MLLWIWFVCIHWVTLSLRISLVLGGDSCFNGLIGGPLMDGACDRPRSPVLGGGREAARFEAGFPQWQRWT